MNVYLNVISYQSQKLQVNDICSRHYEVSDIPNVYQTLCEKEFAQHGHPANMDKRCSLYRTSHKC